MKRSGPPTRKTELKRSGPPKRKQNSARRKPSKGTNEFPEESRQVMRRRSGGICEVGSEQCNGKASQFHHRKLKRHKDQRPINGLHACTLCHTFIHANVDLSYFMGWLVQSFLDPAVVPVKRGERYAEFHRAA